jgi:hypothetical protein
MGSTPASEIYDVCPLAWTVYWLAPTTVARMPWTAGAIRLGHSGDSRRSRSASPNSAPRSPYEERSRPQKYSETPPDMTIVSTGDGPDSGSSVTDSSRRSGSSGPFPVIAPTTRSAISAASRSLSSWLNSAPGSRSVPSSRSIRRAADSILVTRPSSPTTTRRAPTENDSVCSTAPSLTSDSFVVPPPMSRHRTVLCCCAERATAPEP